MHLTFIKEVSEPNDRFDPTERVVPVIRETGERLDDVTAVSVESEIDGVSILRVTVVVGRKKAEWKC